MGLQVTLETFQRHQPQTQHNKILGQFARNSTIRQVPLFFWCQSVTPNYPAKFNFSLDVRLQYDRLAQDLICSSFPTSQDCNPPWWLTFQPQRTTHSQRSQISLILQSTNSITTSLKLWIVFFSYPTSIVQSSIYSQMEQKPTTVGLIIHKYPANTGRRY